MFVPRLSWYNIIVLGFQHENVAQKMCPRTPAAVPQTGDIVKAHREGGVARTVAHALADGLAVEPDLGVAPHALEVEGDGRAYPVTREVEVLAVVAVGPRSVVLADPAGRAGVR